MAQKIDDASKSQYNVNAGPEATKLTKDINRASRTLSIIVTQMTYDLNSFVSTLEKIQVKVKKEGSLAERILRWLKSPFKAITTIFASRTPPISGTARHHADPNLRERGLVNTALGQATSKFCRVDAGAFLEHIILPLQLARTEVIDSLMQDPRRGKSLRASTP
jgi:hypothetical protein